MDFVIKSFHKDETLTSWPLLQHICPHFWTWLLNTEFHLSEMTLLEIPYFTKSICNAKNTMGTTSFLYSHLKNYAPFNGLPKCRTYISGVFDLILDRKSTDMIIQLRIHTEFDPIAKDLMIIKNFVLPMRLINELMYPPCYPIIIIFNLLSGHSLSSS